MVFAKELPFMYTDAFIAIAIIVMVLLAAISFVLVPLFVFRKTPNRKESLIIGIDHKLNLNEELSRYFSSITINERIVTLIPLEGVEKVRVALYFPALIKPIYMVYDLDFVEYPVYKIAFPDHYNKLQQLLIVDNKSRDLDGKSLTSLTRFRLWVFSIASGVALAGAIFMMVLVLSTHLLEVRVSYVGNYFFSLIGLAMIPGIYFLLRFVFKKLESRGE